MAKVTRRSFVVEGSGEFPYDMLRYDQCWPKSEAEDSPQLKGDPDTFVTHRRVTLVTDNQFAPTKSRWQSFTWKVIEVNKEPQL